MTGIAAALALFIFFGERRDNGGEAPSTAVVTGFKRDQVSVIEITLTNQPLVRLRKVGSLWNLESPLHYPAHPVAAERWLQLLEQARWVVRLSSDELKSQGATLADFGLEPPQLTVSLQDGDRITEVRLGNRLAVGKQCYLQIGGQSDVFVVDNQLVEALPPTATAWRDTALVTFTSIAVSNKIAFDRVEVRPATNGYTLQPDPLAGWRITRPISARGDATKISQLVWMNIPYWRIEEFVSDDPAADLAAYGLQTPEQELVIGRGTNDLLTVQFGRSPTNRPDLVYARLLRHTNIVLTARTNLDWLRLPYSLWRDRLLVRLDTNRVSEIVGGNGLTNGNYRVRQETNGLWRVIEPVVLPADAALVSEFFAQLNGIEIGFEKDVVTDFAAYGLLEPARQFALMSATHGITTNLYPTVSFGTNLTGITYARRSDETAVYSIQPNTFHALPLAHWQWRERTIWEYQTNEVQRVRLWHNGKTREVVRSPEGRWSLAAGSTGALDLSFDEAILQLGSLRADRWVGLGRPEISRPLFGFASNQAHRVAVEISRKGVLQTNVVEFGGINNEGRPYAAVQLDDGQTWFFEFPLPLFYQFVKRSFVLPDGL